MNNISLTVPMDENALTRAAEMLEGLASDLSGEKTLESETHAATSEAEVTSALSLAASTTALDDQYITEPEATKVFAQQPEAAPKPEAAETATPVPAGQNLPAEVDVAPATTNPEISIPWDARIHSGSKTKLVKTPHGWKMKRGIATDLVATVEAELIAAMTASPANPVEPAPAPAAQTAASPAPASAPAQPPAPAGAVTTFPELMVKITASGIDQATVTAAVNKQGLQTLPLLAARPDLIPAVASELFPGS